MKRFGKMLTGQKKKRIVFLVALLLLAGIYYFSLPQNLFKAPTCTIVEDRNGQLLGARIADDGQWRFPPSDIIPENFKQCLLHFEDEYFYQHIGFNPVSLLRALRQNLSAGKIVSGGSTLSMQVIRLSRKNKPRTVFEKLLEIILATRLELTYSKDEILQLYATHAPFGGNTVGLETAAWRYYERKPDELSWAESATLAVLPNQPGLIFPGKNHQQLRKKRNFLLTKLYRKQIIDSLTMALAFDEPLPGKPFPLPALSNHLIDKIIIDGKKGQKINTTINNNWQQKFSEILNSHHQSLKGNEIHNAALLVLSVDTGETLAYIGNIGDGARGEHGQHVDIISAPRSTGSILKPFLFAAMLEEGQILPGTLLPDIPTFIQGFAPKNFSKTYDGAVPADRALSRSLNIPAVNMLKTYGVEKFHYLLKAYGLNSLTFPASHYGLSLILGGAEGSLWEICGMYANMARTLNNYFKYPEPLRYHDGDLHPPFYERQDLPNEVKKNYQSSSDFSAAAIWQTFQTMLEVYRPGEDASWQYYDSSQKIAWKTGTSFGLRDGWAVGITPAYVVGVWVGNADGEGRPGLTGINTAGPILFDVFDQLPASQWFSTPTSDLGKIAICRESGHRNNKFCPTIDTIYSHKKGLLTDVCPYHRLIHLDVSKKYRVNAQCEDIQNIIHEPWLVLPPVQAYYYRSKTAHYRSLPPYRHDCRNLASDQGSMQVIYPKNRAQLLIPTELDGKPGAVVFDVAHTRSNTEIFWHLDEKFMASTHSIHQMALHPKAGPHKLTLVDQYGEVLEHEFEIIDH
ncbi:penicillin-binding protein 1C [Fulvivirgaceae bacterium BMA12]|uniref:peptidoglycan glycosyltransferase n=1 Tax=Agaribacillus aureus TaxID=3051825 RepID=A0ABT8LC92_9BACT|nr:penicillin-binding protein 1C [Fulvivirgaceae bacterium BMA12]